MQGFPSGGAHAVPAGAEPWDTLTHRYVRVAGAVLPGMCVQRAGAGLPVSSASLPAALWTKADPLLLWGWGPSVGLDPRPTAGLCSARAGVGREPVGHF